MPKKTTQDYDVIINGGGLAGLTQALLCAHYGFKTLCLDIQKADDVLKADYDGRTTAISYGSMNLLSEIGVWQKLEKNACPILDIHIRDGATPTLLQFLSKEVEDKAFGWIVDNLDLRKVLIKTAKATKGLDYKDATQATDFVLTDDTASVTTAKGKTFSGALLIAADGRMSSVRQSLDIACKQWDYGQKAVVFIAYHDAPHKNVAVEHFRKEGPFAILPMTDDKDGAHRSSVVWTEHQNSSVSKFDDETFLAAVQTRFGDYFGKVIKTGKRFEYPLSYQHADRYIGTRTALIAEAAHVMHPIAGQGLNMSLRDCAALTELIVDARDAGIDIGSEEILSKYETWRKKDNRMMGMATDGLNRLFSNPYSPVSTLRNAGLELVKRTPFAKQFFMRQAMGQMGDLPRLIKGEAL